MQHRRAVADTFPPSRRADRPAGNRLGLNMAGTRRDQVGRIADAAGRPVAVVQAALDSVRWETPELATVEAADTSVAGAVLALMPPPVCKHDVVFTRDGQLWARVDRDDLTASCLTSFPKYANGASGDSNRRQAHMGVIWADLATSPGFQPGRVVRSCRLVVRRPAT